jgi:hypothetical protein
MDNTQLVLRNVDNVSRASSQIIGGAIAGSSSSTFTATSAISDWYGAVGVDRPRRRR